MYTNIWAKYLPVIRIVLKRSLSAEQNFSLNASDFVKAGLTRKTGYKFALRFKEGKLDNVIIDIPVASSLATVLLEDQVIKDLFAENEFAISMNPKFQLNIRHIRHIETVKQEEAVAEIA
ncbi:MAG TPA: hypothetical protein VM368_08425 [Flavisolibacter sp.]|nr:hypothetical protein [Flavisolibacter sp.]